MTGPSPIMGFKGMEVVLIFLGGAYNLECTGYNNRAAKKEHKRNQSQHRQPGGSWVRVLPTQA